ncbi:MAG: response regulator [Candidatus Obscuribacterales bacterium]|nr:response regulator [Steroidobacteraceae bacterium]
MPWLAAALAVSVGVLVMCSWIFGMAVHSNVLPIFWQIEIGAALAFTLAGISLGVLHKRNQRAAWVAQLCATAIALVGLLTLAEYLFVWHPAISQLFADRIDGLHSERIPPISAVNFLLLGLTLLLLDVYDDRRWPAQWFALAIAIISFVVILGVAYDVTSPTTERSSRPSVLLCTLLFFLLSMGALVTRPERGLMAKVFAADSHSFLIRRLLPAAILVPPVIGWLRLQGEQPGLFGTNFGVALFATSNVVIFSILILNTAAAVRRSNAEKQATEQKLHAQLTRVDLLNRIATAIGERQDLRSVYQVVIQNLENHLAIDFGCIARYHAASAMLTVETLGTRSAVLAAELALAENARIAVDGDSLARCVAGALVYEPNTRQVPFPFAQQLANVGLCSFVVAPLRVEAGVFGVLLAARRAADSFSSADCEFLRQLSEHVALATQQADLYGALQQAYDDLRNSQQVTMQQERLRALGQLASGIAHDINNALSPMSLYADSLLEREQNLSEEGRGQLSTIQLAIEDIAHTVSRMRDFYRPRESQLLLAPVDFNQLVHHVVDLTRPRWRDLSQERGIMIELRLDLTALLPNVMGVETEIRDALTNLVLNAIDAMTTGGVLTIRTRALRKNDGGQTAEPVDYLCMEVSDTGTGMDQETQRRCLEPFFTTKGERGTGLGLAMVYGMVKRHSGELEIDSEMGAGTTVRLIFPSSTYASRIAPPTMPTPIQPQRILAIDDDPLLLHVLRDTLASDGHEVFVADGGQTGIDMFHEANKRGEPFTVVITDLGMPYMDGRKVAEAIRATTPDIFIILLTGWGQRLLSTNEIPAAVDRVLAKPPKLQDLRNALAELPNGLAQNDQ